MKAVLGNLRYWGGGAAVAASGVVIARTATAELLGSTRLVIVLLGQLIALSGLMIICVGVSQRVRRETKRTKQP